jgi:hypothetical protein
MPTSVDSRLRLQNDSQLKDEHWWEWSVWVEGPADELARVKKVTYRLHPTFPNPVQHVQDPASNFKLKGAGWGEFALVADVAFEDGRTTRLERWLELRGRPDPMQAGEAHATSPRPKVFVSHSLTDNAIVHELRKALQMQGLEVCTGQSIGAGMDWELEIRDFLRSADAVLPVVSDPPSDFVESEAQLAISAGRIVLPVVLGDAKLPPSLLKLSHFRLSEPRNVGGLADSVAARVKDLVLPEEE